MELIEKMKVSGIAFDEECRWLWDNAYEALYRWDNQTNIICRVGNFTGKMNYISCIRLLIYKNKIIGVPGMSDEIMIYDKEKEEFRYVEVGIPKLHSKVYKGNKFLEGIIDGSYIYLSGSSPYVLKMNLETEKVEGYVDLYENMPGADNIRCTCSAVLMDGNLYIFSSDYNCVFEVDSKTLDYRKIEIPDVTGGFYAHCQVGSDIWLVLQEEPAIVKWNPGEQKIEKREIHLNDFVFSKFYKMGLIFFWNDTLWLFQIDSEQPMIGYNLKTQEWKHLKNFSDYFNRIKNGKGWKKRFMLAKQIEKNFFFLIYPDLDFIRLDLEKDEIQTEQYFLEKREIEERRKEQELRLKNNIKSHRLVMERENTLEDYLRILKANDCFAIQTCEQKSNSIGKTIYEHLNCPLQ